MVHIPQGYRFAAVAAGFKRQDRLDLGLAVSDAPATAAAVFTTNKFQAAPVLVAKDILEKKTTTRAVMINAGQANACTGDEGLKNCRETLDLAAKALGCAPEDILPASTGVIGKQMDMQRWREVIPDLAAGLGKVGPIEFARAIMTTDAFPKIASAEVRGARVFGVCKGAGMICPNMATMLGVVFCDARVEPELWRRLIREAADLSFNRITVDGDTSTNDTVYGLANGASGVVFDEENAEDLSMALIEVCQKLASLIVEDAEGGTKILRIVVQGAQDDAQAELAGRTVGNSPLVKTAFYGKDANWGRIVAALGRSGADFDPNQVSVSIAGVQVFKDGMPVNIDFDSLLKPALRRGEVDVEIVLGEGQGVYSLLASDLTHEYVSVNADYRT
jgi:glutamate N-acetyltransferase/amino-acid N-acetyltransferase